MPLCLLLTIDGREVVITLTNQAVTPPAVLCDGRETELEAAIRLGQDTPVTEIALSKTWNLGQIFAALALAGVVLKDSLIADGYVMPSDKLLVDLRALATADNFRGYLQGIFAKGDWTIRIPNARDLRRIQYAKNPPPLYGGAQRGLTDGDAWFVG